MINNIKNLEQEALGADANKDSNGFEQLSN